jgi:putative oxidoreductase
MLKALEGTGKWGHLVLQILLGFIFSVHGAQKLFGPSFFGPTWDVYLGFFTKFGITPAPLWLWVVALTEFFGGVCICFGFLTRFWAVGLAIDMTVAIVKVHSGIGFFWQRPGGGLEFPLTLGLIALSIVLIGPSFLSVDRAIGLEGPGV